MSKSAIVINSNNTLALAVIRRLCRLGYAVYPLVSNLDSCTIEHLQYTNPELVHQFHIIKLDLSDSNTVDTIKTVVPKADVVVDLNGSEEELDKWDLDILKELYRKNVIEKDSAVVIGRTMMDGGYTTNRALQEIVSNIGDVIAQRGTHFADLMNVSALPDDQNYVADVLLQEVARSTFKVEKIIGLADFVKYVVYYYIPGFLLSLFAGFSGIKPKKD